MSIWLGFVCAGISVLLFGSNFVPVKKFETGDGLFFQWVMASAILIVGMIVNVIRGSPKFHPFAMLGGALWATGNVTVVPIVKMIGLGLGLLTWGLCCMLTGWLVANFGLFGLKSQAVDGDTARALNYTGAAVAILSMLPYVFIQTNANPAGSTDTLPEEHTPLLINIEGVGKQTPEGMNFFERLPTNWRKLLGFSLSVVAGILYGLNFDPPQYLIDHNMGPSQGIDYVFAHFCGIFFTSMIYFALYCAVKGNAPLVYSQAILPGMISGGMWAVAQTLWFVANDNLGMVITFPIISTAPGVIGALWGLIAFREIRGKRNYLLLATAFSLTAVGITLITLSKLLDK